MRHYLFPAVQAFIADLDPASIEAPRRQALAALVPQLQAEAASAQGLALNFICTHNSRRSHMAQVWAQVMAAYFEQERVYCYSGGTEATAVFPMVIETLAQQGLQSIPLSDGPNPLIALRFSPQLPPVLAFSKRYSHSFNPAKNFVALLTCDQAAADCPVVHGAALRFSLSYADPKAYDQSPLQAQKYRERSRQIATEMHFLFSQMAQ